MSKPTYRITKAKLREIEKLAKKLDKELNQLKYEELHASDDLDYNKLWLMIMSSRADISRFLTAAGCIESSLAELRLYAERFSENPNWLLEKAKNATRVDNASDEAKRIKSAEIMRFRLAEEEHYEQLRVAREENELALQLRDTAIVH